MLFYQSSLHLPKIGSMSSKAHIYNTTCTDLHETHSREKKTSSVSFVLYTFKTPNAEISKKNINKIWIYSERICTKNSEINPVEKILCYIIRNEDSLPRTTLYPTTHEMYSRTEIFTSYFTIVSKREKKKNGKIYFTMINP
ncbi:hypothetical protein RirG_229760 [Rhizophagus irregularis DAOM 197198w]|uniref:Uncharacterized protein n=1 Tax=Rhizophagus irregularis (strain DAOM 197198w) TaxID=1432141 RepID=A0A015ILC1_RHIIW|nr:hypothetical protein RirG_229760 [Rhizophagus irregularis DAOM 197198w]